MSESFTNPPAYQEIAEAIRAHHLETPLDQVVGFDVETPECHTVGVLSDLGFDQAPVFRDGSPVGFVLVADLDMQGGGHIETKMQILGPEHLVPGESSLERTIRPHEGRQKRSSSTFLAWSHAGEDLQAGDLTGEQRSKGTLSFEDFARPWVTSQIVDQNRSVDRCCHSPCCGSRDPDAWRRVQWEPVYAALSVESAILFRARQFSSGP